MLRTYKINGETFTMTQAENDDRDAEELAYSTAKPMNDWTQSMGEQDEIISRVEEDILGGMNPSDYANVSQFTKDKLAAKQLKRSQRP
jgi:hypothetical protein